MYYLYYTQILLFHIFYKDNNSHLDEMGYSFLYYIYYKSYNINTINKNKVKNFFGDSSNPPRQKNKRTIRDIGVLIKY